MGTLNSVAAAAGTFIASHLLLSHPLRRPLVKILGEAGFQGLYSLIALAVLGWLILAYLAAPVTEALWPVSTGVWALATLLMLVASILLMGSLIRNPAFPTAGRGMTLPASVRGVYAVTRHPMLWSFALWGACHIAVFPVAKNIIVCATMSVLALAGASLQDAKKAALQPQLWREWMGRTSYLPFAAIVSGRAHFGGFALHTWGGGVVLWLAATWAHLPLAGWAAGIWRWI